MAGTFAAEVLGKRLLSCPVSFADSWWRCRMGMAQAERAEADEVRAAERATDEDTGDDREAESRTAHAAHVVGAWMQQYAEPLRSQMAEIDAALARLGLDADDMQAPANVPSTDARFDALCRWVDAHLRAGTGWRDDERLVIFTEYKTTLDYLERRLRAKYHDASRAVRILFGGMDLHEREAIDRVDGVIV